MDEISTSDRSIIHEIILGFFELFDKRSFTRHHVFEKAKADRDMPKIEGVLAAMNEEFDVLVAEGKILLVSGSGEGAEFKLRPPPGRRR